MAKPHHNSHLNDVEIQLIRWLVGATRSHKPLEAPYEVSRSGTIDANWTLLFEVARRHRIAPLMFEGYRNLSETITLPPEFDDRLENAFYANLAMSVVQLDHLHDLLQTAEAHDAPVNLLKGAAFSSWLYEHPALRPMADLDILVGEADFDFWAASLDHELGFEHQETSDHASLFRHRMSGTYLELHRSLTSCSGYLGLETDALIKRSQPAPGFNSEALRHLSPEDHLLHLCLHGSFQHGFRQAAINAWDAVLLANETSFDWQSFSKRAEDPRLTAWVYGGLTMSHRVFPSRAIEIAIADLEPLLPRKLHHLAAGLNGTELLSASQDSTFGSPWSRLSWTQGFGDAAELIWETLRPREVESSEGARLPSIKRGLQILWDHGVPLLKEKDKPLTTGSVSLSEVSDV